MSTPTLLALRETLAATEASHNRLQLLLENNRRALQQAREQAGATVQAGKRAA